MADPGAPTLLARKVADQIVGLIRAESLPSGAPLTERRLADRIRVSRSPVKIALAILEQKGVVRAVEKGGYVVASSADFLAALPSLGSEPADERLYTQLFDDRLTGRLPARVSENELLRRYQLPKAQIRRLLHRLVAEGCAERLPGHGWAFLPLMQSVGSTRDSLRFRAAIEPAALVEPTFLPNVPALAQRRRQQIALAEGTIAITCDGDLFAINAGLHETIVACSHNAFFIDALRRINRLRQLMVRHQPRVSAPSVARCTEHVAMIDLILSNRRDEAAAMMHDHLARSAAPRAITVLREFA
jgi:DNA-binding GntR family transcriptional regulator